MAAAFLTTVVALAGAVLIGRSAAPPSFVERLQFALRADIFVVAWMVAAIANVARLRFLSPADISGSDRGSEEASDAVRVAGAILQNTVEQTGLAMATHLIVAATFGGSDAIVATLAGLFVIGRCIFWTGYRFGAGGRAFGFALTFYPSVLALVAAAVALVSGWPG